MDELDRSYNLQKFDVGGIKGKNKIFRGSILARTIKDFEKFDSDYQMAKSPTVNNLNMSIRFYDVYFLGFKIFEIRKR